jgi:hypothetical protein
MRTVEVEKRLADLAAGQWGLVTTPQATALGVTHSQLNRLVEQDVITRLSHGVYQLRSAPTDRHIDLRAAWLALAPKLTAGQRLRNPNDEPIVSHASAASLRGWGDLTAYDNEFTFDGRKQTRRDGVRIHRGSTPKADVEIVNGLPTTTAERLIADLLAANYDTDHIGAVLAGAIHDRSIDLEPLAKRVAAYATRRGFSDPAGSELVAALVRSGNAQDEAVADSLVRLAKVDYRHSPGLNPAILAAFQQSIANIPMPQLDPAILAAFQQSIANIPMPQLDPAMLASLRESIAPTAARIVAGSGAAEAMREIAGRPLADVATTNVRHQRREAQRVLNNPAIKRALADARKVV